MSSDEYLFHVEPYSGSTTKLPQTGLRKVFDAVLGLMDNKHAREGNHIVMDNLITSIQLPFKLYLWGYQNGGVIPSVIDQNCDGMSPYHPQG